VTRRAGWLVGRRQRTCAVHPGRAELAVESSGVDFREGAWLCADPDGIVVLSADPAPR
jgi:regulator of ribonuclease activity A